MNAQRQIEPFRTMREVLASELDLRAQIAQLTAAAADASPKRGRKAAPTIVEEPPERETLRAIAEVLGLGSIDDNVLAHVVMMRDEAAIEEALKTTREQELAHVYESLAAIAGALDLEDLDVDVPAEAEARDKAVVEAIKKLKSDLEAKTDELERATEERTIEAEKTLDRVEEAIERVVAGLQPILGYDHVDDTIEIYNARRAIEDLQDAAVSHG